MLRATMSSAASAMSVFGSTVSMFSLVMPSLTGVACGSPPDATRFTMSRSVTMPARPSPSVTTTEEIPWWCITLATSEKVSSGEAVFTSVFIMSPTSIAPPSDAGARSVPGGGPRARALVVAPAGELELVNLQARDPRRREEELARELRVASPHRPGRQRREDRLREPEVRDGVLHLAVLDQERPVPGHARDRRIDRVDDIRVMEPRDEQSAVGRGDHVFGQRVAGLHVQVQGERSLGVGGGKRVTGRLLARLFGRSEVVDAV